MTNDFTGSAPDGDVALMLAWARLNGGASLGHVPLRQAEEVARAAGRDVVQCPGPTGTVTSWAWPAATEPGESTARPKLARRSLCSTALRTFLIAYAELTDPGTTIEVPVVPHSRLITLCTRLLGPGVGPTWSAAALRRDLIFAHLLTPVDRDDVMLGPAVAGMDPLRRRQLDAAAVRLRTSPRWPDPDPEDAALAGTQVVRLDDVDNNEVDEPPNEARAGDDDQ